MNTESLAEKMGFASAYAVFTAFMYLAATLSNKLPADWTPLHVAGVTLGVTAVGLGLERYLR